MSEADYNARMEARSNRFHLAVVPDLLDAINELSGSQYERLLSFEPFGTRARERCLTKIAMISPRWLDGPDGEPRPVLNGTACAFYEDTALEPTGFRLDVRFKVSEFKRGLRRPLSPDYKNQKSAEFAEALEDPKVRRFSTPQYEVYLGKKEGDFRPVTIEGIYPVPASSRVHYVSRPDFEKTFLGNLKKAESLARVLFLEQDVDLVWYSLDFTAVNEDLGGKNFSFTSLLFSEGKCLGSMEYRKNSQSPENEMTFIVPDDAFDKVLSSRITNRSDSDPQKLGPAQVTMMGFGFAGKSGKRVQITFDAKADFSELQNPSK